MSIVSGLSVHPRSSTSAATVLHSRTGVSAAVGRAHDNTLAHTLFAAASDAARNKRSLLKQPYSNSIRSIPQHFARVRIDIDPRAIFEFACELRVRSSSSYRRKQRLSTDHDHECHMFHCRCMLSGVIAAFTLELPASRAALLRKSGAGRIACLDEVVDPTRRALLLRHLRRGCGRVYHRVRCLTLRFRDPRPRSVRGRFARFHRSVNGVDWNWRDENRCSGGNVRSWWIHPFIRRWL
jgi:hypothetical protein